MKRISVYIPLWFEASEGADNCSFYPDFR